MDRTSDTREMILEAAREKFAQKGYQGATIAEIAGKAGISEGAIYRHFNRKKELLVACVEPVLEGIMEIMDEEIPKSGNLMELTKKSLEIRLKLFENHYQTFKILFNELPYSREIFDIYVAFIMKQESKVHQMFENIKTMGLKRTESNYLLFGLGQIMSLWIYLNFKTWAKEESIDLPKDLIEFDDQQVIDDLANYIMYGIAGVPDQNSGEAGENQ